MIETMWRASTLLKSVLLVTWKLKGSMVTGMPHACHHRPFITYLQSRHIHAYLIMIIRYAWVCLLCRYVMKGFRKELVTLFYDILFQCSLTQQKISPWMATWWHQGRIQILVLVGMSPMWAPGRRGQAWNSCVMGWVRTSVQIMAHTTTGIHYWLSMIAELS